MNTYVYEGSLLEARMAWARLEDYAVWEPEFADSTVLAATEGKFAAVEALAGAEAAKLGRYPEALGSLVKTYLKGRTPPRFPSEEEVDKAVEAANLILPNASNINVSEIFDEVLLREFKLIGKVTGDSIMSAKDLFDRLRDYQDRSDTPSLATLRDMLEAELDLLREIREQARRAGVRGLNTHNALPDIYGKNLPLDEPDRWDEIITREIDTLCPGTSARPTIRAHALSAKDLLNRLRSYEYQPDAPSPASLRDMLNDELGLIRAADALYSLESIFHPRKLPLHDPRQCDALIEEELRQLTTGAEARHAVGLIYALHAIEHSGTTAAPAQPAPAALPNPQQAMVTELMQAVDALRRMDIAQLPEVKGAAVAEIMTDQQRDSAVESLGQLILCGAAYRRTASRSVQRQ